MIREFFKELNLKREKAINPEEREDENPEIIKLKEIVDNKLASEEAPVSVFENPNEAGIEKSKREKRLKKISENKKALQKTTEKTKLIESFAERLLTEHQIGIEPDDKYLEDIADMAIDYYTPHHVEWVRSSDEHLTNVERESESIKRKIRGKIILYT